MTPSTFSCFSNACSSLTHAGSGLAAVVGEFLQRDPALGLQTDVDQRHVLFDRNDAALDDRTLERLLGAVGLVEQSSEVVTRRRERLCGSHSVSWGPLRAAPALGLALRVRARSRRRGPLQGRVASFERRAGAGAGDMRAYSGRESRPERARHSAKAGRGQDL
jgi:hypothetical protein